MKLSQIILEEYQEQLKKFDGIEIPMKTISEGLRMFTQAYKDALYMEGEIEKVDMISKECQHQGRTSYNIETNRHDFLCDICGWTKSEDAR
jgi:2-hydroxy-3-keto-5-methylthiopentenyl-1-phosphate phosphatase